MKLLFSISVLFSLVANAQDTIRISDKDLQQAMTANVLPTNDVFSGNDTVLTKTNGPGRQTITARLKKFNNAFLVISKTTDGFAGRFMYNPFVANTDYYELKKASTGYIFVKDKNPIQHYESGPMVGAANVPAVIYLDMNGGTVTGTMWNSGGPIVYSRASFEGNADTIAYILANVSESYAAFNIVVTTDSAVWAATPINKRMWINVTPSCSWYSCGVGGISYVNSITWGDDTPAWAFLTGSNTTNLKNISEAIAHECGHLMGLQHQSTYNGSCVKTAEYNPGYGSGETGFAPLMGVSYSKNMAIWWTGTNALGCSEIQNDVERITSVSGLKIYDVGNKWQNAKVIQNGQSHYHTLRPSDSSWYRFDLEKPATITVTATPYSQGSSNANARSFLALDIRNKKRQMVGTSANTTTLNSSVSVALDPGTYYIVVRANKSHANNPTGYGFFGHYTINLSY